MKEGFYVTVVDAGRVGYLLGPYGTQPEAATHVERARTLAERKDAWAHFYAFGTAKVTGRQPNRTVFGR